MSISTDSATLLHDARRLAGLTQAGLAARAGVAQSVISAYESGTRQPSVPTLVRLINAAGCELDLQVRPAPRKLDVLTGPIGGRVRNNRQALLAVARTHGLGNLRVLTSVERGKDQSGDSVKLVADIPSDMGRFERGEVRNKFEAILGMPVDLIPANDLTPGDRDRVLQEAIAL